MDCWKMHDGNDDGLVYNDIEVINNEWLFPGYVEYDVPAPGLKPDYWIRDMAVNRGMIEPFVDGQVQNGVISYGLSSYGYDIRVSDEFKIFTPTTGHITVIDPKNFDVEAMVDFVGGVCVIPPNSFALATSLEYICMPSDVAGIVLGKSTYARAGIVTNFTPLEPGWEGNITIEISNTTPLPAKIYANEGIAQVLFFEGCGEPEVTYADRDGKYQRQEGVTLARVK